MPRSLFFPFDPFCQLESDFDSVVSVIMAMENWAVPEFVEGFKALRLQQGNDAMFRGQVKGNPRPKVHWTRKGKNLPSSDKYELRHDPESGTVSLTIRNLGPGDEGQYCCTASNDYGSVSATLSVNAEVGRNSRANGDVPHGKRCLSPGCSRATLQRQRVLREQQLKTGSDREQTGPANTMIAQGL